MGGGNSLKILANFFFTFGIIPHFDLNGGGGVGGYGHLIRAEGGGISFQTGATLVLNFTGVPLTEQQIRRAVYSIVDNKAIGELRGFNRKRIVDEILRIEINDRNSIHGRILESTWLTWMAGFSTSTLRSRLLCL